MCKIVYRLNTLNKTFKINISKLSNQDNFEQYYNTISIFRTNYYLA